MKRETNGLELEEHLLTVMQVLIQKVSELMEKENKIRLLRFGNKEIIKI